jgi:homoserine O-acetyltransferase
MRNGLFPQITIRDMVNSQYKLVTEIFKLKHLFAAIGGSMGSMQVLEWAVAYPDFIDKIIAYVATPKMSSFDLLWMNTQLTMIESSRKNGMSEKEIKKISDMMTAIIARTPAYTIENTRVQDIPSYIASFDKEPSKVFTLDNYVTLLKAMMKHDISLEYNESMEQAAKSIKAKLFIIVSKTDMMVNPTEALRLIDLTNAKKLILQNNCGHLAVSCEIDKCREEIAKFLNN